MSKEAEARVRDELLQSLYAGTLRGTLALAQAGVSMRTEASASVAAGICANLRPGDILLLPRRGAGAFRVLRGLGFQAAQSPLARDLAAGVLPLPKNEAAASSFALGAAAAAAHTGTGALVCVFLPSSVMLADTSAKPNPGQITRTGNTAAAGNNASSRHDAGTWSDAGTWTNAAAQASRLGLALLLVSDQPVRQRAGNAATTQPTHLPPAPLYPSIPVDREDALAIYRVAFECASRARAGGGPSHIASVPFRVRGQQAAEVGALTKLEAMLRKRSAFHKAWRRQLERQIILEISQPEHVLSSIEDPRSR